jgi:hypothetical protein
VHARLVKAALGEANHGRLQDLLAAVGGNFSASCNHLIEKRPAQ